MPKARVERVLSDDGTTRSVEVEVGERGVTKVAQYSVPSNASKFQELVLGLTLDTRKDANGKEIESSLEEAYRLFVMAVDRRARAEVYESLAQESTMISVGKERVDIMTFPIARLVKGINGMRSQVDLRTMAGGDTEDARTAAERSIGFGPWRTAARKLADEKKAKENEATGMLELVTA
jgi:hypothetical protein